MGNPFDKLYERKENEQYVSWIDGQYFGFSVLRDYPTNIAFLPAKSENGNDTKVLIKIGYFSGDVDGENVQLIALVRKYNTYLSEHLDYDFADKSCPTKASIDASKNSVQPIDLEENNRYTFNIAKSEIFDKEKNKNINVSEIVDLLYREHIQTIKSLRATVLRTKITIRDRVCRTLTVFKKHLLNLMRFLLGKTLVVPTNDWLAGEVEPYKKEYLKTIYPEIAIPFFQSELRISKSCLLFTSISIIILWIGCPPIFNSINSITQISIIIVLVFLFDTIIPLILFQVINFLIYMKRKLEFKRFKF